jgi:hypothetical protein
MCNTHSPQTPPCEEDNASLRRKLISPRAHADYRCLVTGCWCFPRPHFWLPPISNRYSNKAASRPRPTTAAGMEPSPTWLTEFVKLVQNPRCRVAGGSFQAGGTVSMGRVHVVLWFVRGEAESRHRALAITVVITCT